MYINVVPPPKITVFSGQLPKNWLKTIDIMASRHRDLRMPLTADLTQYTWLGFRNHLSVKRFSTLLVCLINDRSPLIKF